MGTPFWQKNTSVSLIATINHGYNHASYIITIMLYLLDSFQAVYASVTHFDPSPVTNIWNSWLLANRPLHEAKFISWLSEERN